MAKSTLRKTLTSIRNAARAGKQGVEVQKNRISYNLAKIFLYEGLIENISEFSYLSKHKTSIPFLLLRFTHSKNSEIPQIADLSLRKCKSRKFRNHDLIILSTSGGLMTACTAYKRNLGGEIICYV